MDTRIQALALEIESLRRELDAAHKLIHKLAHDLAVSIEMNDALLRLLKVLQLPVD